MKCWDGSWKLKSVAITSNMSCYTLAMESMGTIEIRVIGTELMMMSPYVPWPVYITTPCASRYIMRRIFSVYFISSLKAVN